MNDIGRSLDQSNAIKIWFADVPSINHISDLPSKNSL